MPGRPPFDAAIADRARELKHSGKSREQVRAILAAEGHKVSSGWVSKVCTAPAAPRKPQGAPAAPAPKSASGPPAARPGATSADGGAEREAPADAPRELVLVDRAQLDELRAELGRAKAKSAPRWLALLEAAIAAAPEDAGEVDLVAFLQRTLATLVELSGKIDKGNVEGQTKVARVVGQLGAVLARVTPPERPDPEAAPDMQAAAEQAVEKLTRYVERALEAPR